jgi:protein-serine/threonine kinase
MLAGYLPFDDDPANPEGDNINLLYKYIVNTPLTFPEYVTPHARDLLRRILVPNPRKRADLFEVARHSWLSEYAHVVELITSTTTSPSDVQNIPMTSDEMADGMLGRSASVRETSKRTAVSPTIGGLTAKHGTIDAEAEAAILKQQRDNKRRTVQVEYVAPQSQTQRGEPQVVQSAAGKTRARSGSQGPVEVAASPASPKNKPLPRDPPVPKEPYSKGSRDSRRPPSAHQNQNAAPVTRPNRDGARAASDNAFMTTAVGASGTRPSTGGEPVGLAGMGGGARASYGQPLAPAVAGTNVHGSIQQPKGSKNYIISNPIPQDAQTADYGPRANQPPARGSRVSALSGEESGEFRGHRRSNTIGEIGGKLFGRSGSLFGGRNRKRSEQQTPSEKSRRYPPVSMSNALPAENDSRTSMDSKRSRRSFSLGIGKKRSGSISGSQTSQEKPNRRFSLLPGSFSLKAIGIGKDYGSNRESRSDLPIQDPPQMEQTRREPAQTHGGHMDATAMEGMYGQLSDPQYAMPAASHSSPNHQRFASGQYERRRPSAVPAHLQDGPAGSESSLENAGRRPPRSAPYQQNYEAPQDQDSRRVVSRGQRGVLQKNKRQFGDAYDTDELARPHDHSGSSGAARRVMDFFRRRGKASMN